jgi:3-hydroxyacyl-CoA dehydrogenase
MGPLELADLIGLDAAVHRRSAAPRVRRRQYGTTCCDLVPPAVTGRLGQSSRLHDEAEGRRVQVHDDFKPSRAVEDGATAASIARTSERAECEGAGGLTGAFVALAETAPGAGRDLTGAARRRSWR